MSLSIAIPIYNEEFNIEDTYNNLIKAIKIANLVDFEIIFINDGSTDNSFKIIKKISKKNNKVLVIHSKKNLGLSTSIFKAFNKSKKKFVWWLPSDNNVEYKEISKIISNYSTKDFVLTKHIMNRNFFRKFVSASYTILVNIIFLSKIPYYNGLFLIRKKMIKKVKIKSKSQFWMAELIINLLKISSNYEIRTIKLSERKKGKSNIFNFKQLYLVIVDLLKFRFSFK
jgi:glycosyltransferase involved in cell wall biosynthesis